MADTKLEKKKEEEPIMKTHIPGFDELFTEGGIPRRNSCFSCGWNRDREKHVVQTDLL